MKQLRIAFAALVSCAALAASCGGNTTRGDDGTGGSSGSGGSGRGGSSGRGGGSSGSGGRPDFCSLPIEPGNCNAYFPSYAYDPATGFCQFFAYGGCEGNENRFASFAECQATCGDREVVACEDNSDCMLASSGCCGACEPSALEDWVAINLDESAGYHTRCGPVACEPCPSPDPTRARGPYFVPTCEAGLCDVVDLQATAVTDCAAPAECKLRNGAECCELCEPSSSSLVSLSDEVALSKLVCGPESACPDCEPPPPDGFIPGCFGGKCAIVSTR